MQPKKIADFYYSTKMAVYGPWLIDANQLTDLDKTIDGVCEQLVAYREECIQREIKDQLKKRLERETEKQPTKIGWPQLRQRFLMMFAKVPATRNSPA